MKALEKFLNKFIGPIANFMSESKFFGTLSEAFMRTTPITLGVAFLMIIGNLPIPGYEQVLIDNGLKVHFDSIIGATTGILSLFVVFNFSYIYAKKSDQNPLSSGLISLASFFIVMPQTVGTLTADGAASSVAAYQQLYTGGTGLFAAIVVAWISSVIYVALNKRNFTIKLPESVPANVSESLSPSLISMVIFTVFFLVRLVFAFTPFDNLFMLIFGVLQLPLQKLAANPLSMIIIFTLANLMWFFGIHPNVVYGVVMPMLLANSAGNIEAFAQGQPLPYLMMAIVGMGVGNGFGGQGATYGFVVASFGAKSERYKQLRRLAAVPAIFNINEPIIFGAPIMLNPTFFIPMILSPIVMGSIGWIMGSFISVDLNPTIAMPWTTPAIVTSFLQGGFSYFIIAFVMMLANIIIWYPFFRIADNQAYNEELEITK